MLGDIPEGNIRISTAILLTGSIVAKSLRMLNEIGLANISYSTYMSHQTKFLLPAINNSFNLHIKEERENLAHTHIIASGDGRADSPGHCAKYGVYALMNVSTRKIMAAELVQVSKI